MTTTTTTTPLKQTPTPLKHKTYLLGAWVILMALTAATWWLGADHGIAGLNRHVLMISILVLTFAKIYVVGQAFMELRVAALWLTRMFTCWCVAVCVILSVMYLTI